MSATDRESYDQMYRSAPALWSGRPNRQLVVEASALPPGTALDAGCGEGGDAVWLAERGWRVTAVDFSALALDRASARARERGLEDRVEWMHADLGTWAPPEGRFDLVTAHYLHATWDDRPAVFRRLAAAVAPGGTLLVVGHVLGESTDHDRGHGRVGGGHGGEPDGGRGGEPDGEALHRHDPEAFWSAEELAQTLDAARWSIVAEIRERDPEATARTGNPAPDTVLVARRRSGAG